MSEALQKAIFDKLSASLSASVYDHVPQNAAFPFVAIGESTTTPRNSHSNRGREITTTIHIWSQYRGSKEVKSIMDQIDQALDNASLTVTGYHHVFTQQEFANVFTETDGETRHGVMRFRSIVED